MKNPCRPGEIIREDVQAPLGLNVTRAAKALGVTRQALPEGRDCRADGLGEGAGLFWLVCRLMHAGIGDRDARLCKSQPGPYTLRLEACLAAAAGLHQGAADQERIGEHQLAKRDATSRLLSAPIPNTPLTSAGSPNSAS